MPDLFFNHRLVDRDLMDHRRLCQLFRRSDAAVSVVSMRLYITTNERRFMGAREKLNSVYFGIAAFAAGCLGIITKCLIVFFVSLVVLAGALLHDGTMRPKRRR